jgi:hypothetical protein
VEAVVEVAVDRFSLRPKAISGKDDWIEVPDMNAVFG